MERVLLVKYGEIMLKGLNRPVFERQLEKNIRHVLKGRFEFEVSKEHGRIFVKVDGTGSDSREAAMIIARVFGIVSVHFAYKTIVEKEQILKAAVEAASIEFASGKKTFKVETKRPNKLFPLSSMELSAIAGDRILGFVHGTSVDVHKPQFKVFIEIRKSAYIYCDGIRAGGGIPVGSSGRGVVLLSGGIDSPVAAYMMAKRGLRLDAIYFHSHPYTSDMAKQKVVDLSSKLSLYCGEIRLHVVDFTEAQLMIYEKCPHEQLTIIMRRAMMMIAEMLANKIGAKALVTGESLGQVASQTMESIGVTNAAVSLPVFRPLIGMDKYEVIDIARKIDTFDISILPYEDCCTIFVAKHPETKPRLDKILESEQNINMKKIVEKCFLGIETIGG